MPCCFLAHCEHPYAPPMHPLNAPPNRLVEKPTVFENWSGKLKLDTEGVETGHEK